MKTEERKKMIQICEELIEVSVNLTNMGRAMIRLVTGLYEVLAEDQEE